MMNTVVVLFTAANTATSFRQKKN